MKSKDYGRSVHAPAAGAGASSTVLGTTAWRHVRLSPAHLCICLASDDDDDGDGNDNVAGAKMVLLVVVMLKTMMIMVMMQQTVSQWQCSRWTLHRLN